MLTYRLLLSYDGTDFCGWQNQPHKRTVQGVIEEALARISGKRIAVTAAGRTDAGVHARGQVASFRADLRLGKEELWRALNALLPDDVRVTSIRLVQPEFHARKSARSKIYQYRIWNARRVSPFLLRYVLYWPYPLDVMKMAEAARFFEREADFTAFSSNRLLHPVRRVTESRIRKKGNEIVYTVKADGFLRFMARTMVGTLLEVGRGKLEPEAVEDIFARKQRSLAGPTAAAKGLCLVRVVY
ncbi:MAG: tRNA pseudouridine(38-40) synthase TruA [Acidobacteriota bacterium]